MPPLTHLATLFIHFVKAFHTLGSLKNIQERTQQAKSVHLQLARERSALNPTDLTCYPFPASFPFTAGENGPRLKNALTTQHVNRSRSPWVTGAETVTLHFSHIPVKVPAAARWCCSWVRLQRPLMAKVQLFPFPNSKSSLLF